MARTSTLKLSRDHVRYASILILLVVLGIVGYYLWFDTGSSLSVQDGDTVTVDYIGTLDDGSLFDTSLADVAQEKGKYVPQRQYKPLTFVVGEGQVVSGFDAAVLGLEKGDTKTFTLSPEDAYGPVNEELILTDLERKSSLNLTVPIPRALFEKSFGEDHKVGDELSSEIVGFPLKIISLNDDTIVVKSLLKKGDSLALPGMSWKSDILSVTDTLVEVMQNPHVGDIMQLPSPMGTPMQGVVTQVDALSYSVDLNHPLAGKSLTFTITIVDVQKKV